MDLRLGVAIAQQDGRALSPPAQAPLNQLIDAMIDVYVSWREECAAVAWSYVNWGHTERPDKHLAFCAHIAALDREAQAAACYRRATERIASRAASPRQEPVAGQQ